MPIYEYQCEKCGHEFEREQRITEDPIKTCPKCRSRKAKRLISRTAFVLKGSGWYSDLYSSGKKSDASTGPSSESGTKGKDKGKSASSTKSDGGGKDSGGSAPAGSGPGKASGSQAAA